MPPLDSRHVIYAQNMHTRALPVDESRRPFADLSIQASLKKRRISEPAIQEITHLVCWKIMLFSLQRFERVFSSNWEVFFVERNVCDLA